MDFNKNKKGRFMHEGLSTPVLALLDVKGTIQGKNLTLLFVQTTRDITSMLTLPTNY
jgi:hypothetical protein